MQPDLLTVCIAAFFAVLLLLSVLAGAIRLLMALFPEREAGGLDPAVVAAINAAVTSAYPGMRVTKIEEKR